MDKINKHIEIVISSRSLSLVNASKTEHDEVLSVIAKHYVKAGITVVDNVDDLKKLVLLKPDLVFLRTKFVFNTDASNKLEKVWISKYLEDHKIAHTGSSYLTHELELNKPMAKARVESFGLKTAPYFIINKVDQDIANIPTNAYPLFVKPTSMANGVGIDDSSLVHNIEQLKSKVCSISSKFDSDSLVEEFLPGREFSVAILKDMWSSKLFGMPIELSSPQKGSKASILSGRVKLSNTENFSQVSDPIIKKMIIALATSAFTALGGRDFGRVDIRIDKYGVPNFIEANLTPSLTNGYGSFPKACRINRGMSYETMILHIVQLGLNRTKPVKILPKFAIQLPLEPALALAV